MRLGRTLRRQVRGAAAPAVFLALACYFMWSATQGDRGLEAAARRDLELDTAVRAQKKAEAEVAVWERSVAALRTRIDADALDERARAMLNLSDPGDVMVPYERSQRLF